MGTCKKGCEREDEMYERVCVCELIIEEQLSTRTTICTSTLLLFLPLLLPLPPPLPLKGRVRQ